MMKRATNGPDRSHPPAPGGGASGCRASAPPVITRRPVPSNEEDHGKSSGRMPAGHLEILTIYISCRDDGFGKPRNRGPDIVPPSLRGRQLQAGICKTGCSCSLCVGYNGAEHIFKPGNKIVTGFRTCEINMIQPSCRT